MVEDDAVGPSLTISGGGGADVPLYLISFDKHGDCMAPRTRAALLAEAASGRYTDLHIYSHGWNNVFDEAVRHYAEFFTEYCGLRQGNGLAGDSYRPLLVGLIWPSTALLAPGEEPPRLARLDDVAPAIGAVEPESAPLAAEMAPDDARQLAVLTSKGPLDGPDALALAQLLAPLLERHANGDGESAMPAPGAAALLRDWNSAALAATVTATATTDAVTDAATPADLTLSGPFSFLNPRELLRKVTVFTMKDRAGVVGSTGVAELVRDAVESSKIRVHLAGHSYGAKVVLAALARLPAPLQVTSVLLLQPAVSARCFAERIPERGGAPGAYRQVLGKTVLPLFTTFSEHDSALNTFYPLALRRGRDLGEIRQVSPFAALGAVGPQEVAQGELEVLPLLDAPGAYAAPAPGIRLRALDGASGISGHGDVRNRYTEWAMASLVLHGAAASAAAA